MCDWIFSPHAHLTPFQQFVHDVDWNQSPVGPMAGWPVQLHQMVLIVMADTSPAAVFFGDETTIIYNEPFSHLIGSSHPALQGQSPKSGFAEIWGQFEDLIAAAFDGGVFHRGHGGITAIAASLAGSKREIGVAHVGPGVEFGHCSGKANFAFLDDIDERVAGDHGKVDG